MSNKKPAKVSTTKSKISKISFLIINVPPKKANGIEPIRNGINSRKL